MRALVTAASKHGSTREIAAAIHQHLVAHEVPTDLLEPEDVTDLSGYDAVVLGSAVYAGHWLEPAKELVDRLDDQLAERMVWLFSSGPVGTPPRPDEDPADVAGLMFATKARQHRVFPGKIDKDQLGLAERAIVKALRAPVGDFRDWESIERWADEIATTMGVQV